MCTRCSVPHQRLLGLPNCLLRLVDQVQDPGRPRSPRLLPVQPRVPRRAFLSLPGPLVCAPFSVGQSFSYSTPLSFKCHYLNYILCIPDAFNSHCCHHVMSLDGAGSCFYSTLNREMPVFIFIHVLL